jgi:hypothetical protein
MGVVLGPIDGNYHFFQKRAQKPTRLQASPSRECNSACQVRKTASSYYSL